MPEMGNETKGHCNLEIIFEYLHFYLGTRNLLCCYVIKITRLASSGIAREGCKTVFLLTAFTATGMIIKRRKNR